jgi:hypothetical protein
VDFKRNKLSGVHQVEVHGVTTQVQACLGQRMRTKQVTNDEKDPQGTNIGSDTDLFLFASMGSCACNYPK